MEEVRSILSDDWWQMKAAMAICTNPCHVKCWVCIRTRAIHWVKRTLWPTSRSSADNIVQAVILHLPARTTKTHELEKFLRKTRFIRTVVTWLNITKKRDQCCFELPNANMSSNAVTTWFMDVHTAFYDDRKRAPDVWNGCNKLKKRRIYRSLRTSTSITITKIRAARLRTHLKIILLRIRYAVSSANSNLRSWIQWVKCSS